VKISLENGKTIFIKAINNSLSNRYIESLKLNGKDYTKNYFIHSILTSGTDIIFDMSLNPNKTRGISENDAPYSFSKDNRRRKCL
jgi:putative alpha-1,2-mannosidase